MIKKLLSLTLVILPLFILAQLQSFTISLTGTPETCPNNGTLSWTTSGATTNATLVYSVYNTSNLSTPVATTTSLSATGLPTGTYRVVATQTLGTQSNQATSSNFTIANQKIAMTSVTSMLVSDAICGTDGSFRVSVTGGRAPYRYQILDSDNQVVSEFQYNSDTYTFTGLAAAKYRYRVVDDCGMALVGEQEISHMPSNFTGISIRGQYTDGCSRVQLSLLNAMNPSGQILSIKYPLSIKISYTNPNTGATEVVEGTDTAMPSIPNFTSLTQIPLRVETTDACGRTVVQDINFLYIGSFREIMLASTCGSRFIRIDQSIIHDVILCSFRVNFTSAPAGFDPSVYNVRHGELALTHDYGSSTQPLPDGNYTYEVTDECGRTTTRSFTMSSGVWNSSISYSFPRQCSNDVNSSVQGQAYDGYTYDWVKITSAPQEFIDKFGPLPYTVPEDKFSLSKDSFHLNDVPPGVYTLELANTCNSDIATRSLTVQEQTPVTPAQVSVELNCGGQFRPSQDAYYQRYYPESGKWGTSPTNLQTDGSGMETPLFWAAANVWNNAIPGRYRIVTYPINYTRMVNNSPTQYYCDPIVLKEFEIGATLTFSNAYAFACANGTYDVALSASGGTAPLTYAIVSSEANDATTIKDNGTNPIFEGLAGGTYFFRVYDQCGNFQTRKLDIAKLGRPGIRMAPVCPTNELSLVVDGLDYLSYEWTKEGDNTVLSNTNVLNLGTYTADKAGIYHVRLSTNSATSCINTTLDLKLTVDALTSANAGLGQTVNLTYDEAMGTSINLFDYLQGNYDGFGTWTETTTPSSSLLIGNQWRVSSAQSGTYSFKYTVTGACGGATDTATVIINLAKVCYKKPVISAAGDALPTKVGITSLSRAGADAQGENWPMVRQGGWIALESNTKGFVVNRVPFDASGLPIGIPATNFVAGMMVYDTTNNCLKVYNGSIWSCFSTQTCPE
ncbi:hypothetical protein PG279_03255 [Riemerella anatipestifer]|nr:hypothetical protein [Riemerella anatipestifer]